MLLLVNVHCLNKLRPPITCLACGPCDVLMSTLFFLEGFIPAFGLKSYFLSVSLSGDPAPVHTALSRCMIRCDGPGAFILIVMLLITAWSRWWLKEGLKMWLCGRTWLPYMEAWVPGPMLGFCLSSAPQLPGNSQVCPSPQLPGNSQVGLAHYKRDCLPLLSLLPLTFLASLLPSLALPFPPPLPHLSMWSWPASTSLLSPPLCLSLPLLLS